jgi:hypothetical protein
MKVPDYFTRHLWGEFRWISLDQVLGCVYALLNRVFRAWHPCSW